MATLDRIRLTGLLQRSPAPAGLLHSDRRGRRWPGQPHPPQPPMEIDRKLDGACGTQVDAVRGEPGGVAARVAVPVEYRHPAKAGGGSVDHLVDQAVLLVDGA